MGGIELNDQSVAGLSVILGQMVAYFRNRVNVDDLDVLNFSLHHLFCRIDYLYITALPELLSSSILAVTEQALSDDLACRQNIWSKLRDIKADDGRTQWTTFADPDGNEFDLVNRRD